MSGGTAVRRLLKRVWHVVPLPLRERAKQEVLEMKARRLEREFARTTPATVPLGDAELESLASRFPPLDWPYKYDPESLLARGRERAAEVVALRARPGRALEIGAADAMTLWALRERGWEAVGVDIELKPDPRAVAAGVVMHQMDATKLDFPDSSFDLVFSYNTFEHLPDPRSTLQEILRVLRPGGIGHLAFAGLGWTPHGSHMYKQIGVPYLTALFDDTTIQRYVKKHGLPGGFPWINMWPVERFRGLWDEIRDRVDVLTYRETRNLFSLPIIRELLPHFRKAPSFESLLVDSIVFDFRKR